MTQKLFSDDGKVWIDPVFRQKFDAKRKEWNPNNKVKQVLELMDRSILNPKGILNGSKKKR